MFKIIANFIPPREPVRPPRPKREAQKAQRLRAQHIQTKIDVQKTATKFHQPTNNTSLRSKCVSMLNSLGEQIRNFLNSLFKKEEPQQYIPPPVVPRKHDLTSFEKVELQKKACERLSVNNKLIAMSSSKLRRIAKLSSFDSCEMGRLNQVLREAIACGNMRTLREAVSVQDRIVMGVPFSHWSGKNKELMNKIKNASDKEIKNTVIELAMVGIETEKVRYMLKHDFKGKGA